MPLEIIQKVSGPNDYNIETMQREIACEYVQIGPTKRSGRSCEGGTEYLLKIEPLDHMY